MSLLSRVGALALACSLLGSTAVVAAPKPAERARMAVHWLSHQQNEDGSFPAFSPIGSTADAVVAMTAAKRSPEDIAEAIDYLETNAGEIDTIGEIAKTVMAVVVSGGDPHDFAGRDLVQEIRDSEQPDGRLGESTEVFNHALAMIALATADQSPTGLPREWLLDAQCEDGGWQFDEPAQADDNAHCSDGSDSDFFTSDTDTTAYSVIALAGLKKWRRRAPQNPFRFFKARRDPIKKGWGYDRTYSLTNANSTGLVIEAFRSHGHYQDVPDGAVRALTRLQYRLCGHRGGAFAFSYEEKDKGGYRKTDPDVGATIGGILGLVNRPYDAVAVTKPPPEPEAC